MPITDSVTLPEGNLGYLRILVALQRKVATADTSQERSRALIDLMRGVGELGAGDLLDAALNGPRILKQPTDRREW